MNEPTQETGQTPETNDDSNKTQRPPFQISDQIAQGCYANALAVAHTSNDFILDFVFSSPSGRNVVSRIILTPERMKTLHGTMADNIKKYEETYGVITRRRTKADA